MRLSDFLDDIGRPIAYYPKLAIFLGSVNATIFLCQLFYWEGKQDDKDGGWIFKTQKEITEETGLSRRETDTARRVLCEKEILVETVRGVPPKMHFLIQRKKLDDLWDEWRKPPNQFGGNRQINSAQSATTIRRKAPDQNGLERQIIIPEITTETTIDHTHTGAPPAPSPPAPAQPGGGGGSRFTFDQRLEWATHQATKPGSSIRDPEAVAEARADGTADERIEKFFNPSPEKSNVNNTGAGTPSQNLFYSEALHRVRSMLPYDKRGPLAIIADLPLDEDVRQRLIEKFGPAKSADGEGQT